MSTNNYIADPRVYSYEGRPPSRRNQHQQRADATSPSRNYTSTLRNGSRSNIPFERTRTLTGAFEAASAPPRASDNHHHDHNGELNGGSPRDTLRRGRRHSIASPNSGGHIDTYRRVDDADNLADLQTHGDEDDLIDQARRGQNPNLSPSPGPRPRHFGNGTAGDIYDSELDFLEGLSDDSLRERLEKHAMDERRLRRVTGKDTPVFSKANVGPKAVLSAENLRRRNVAVAEAQAEETEEDRGVEPSLNIPKRWGTRGRVSMEWLDKASHANGPHQLEDDKSMRLPVNEWENDDDFTAQPLQVSDSPPVMKNVPRRAETHHTQETRPRITNTRRDWGWEDPPQRDTFASNRDTNKTDTPAVVYKSHEKKSKFTPRIDSQGLLRKLARNASASSTRTPEQKITQKTPLSAKTPVVTGAWPDTPVPERVEEAPKVSPKNSSPAKAPPEKILPVKTSPVKETSPNGKIKQESQSPQATKVTSVKQLSKEYPSTLHRKQPKYTRRSIKLEKPKLPKSALEAVLEDARSSDHSLSLGENTIDSLQDLLDEKATDSDQKLLLKRETTEKPLIPSNPSSTSPSSENKEPVADEAMIDRLNTKLQSLVRNINEVRTGLSSLEQQAEKDAKIRAASSSAKQDKKMILPHRHKGTPCEGCGLYGDGRLYFALPNARFWRRARWGLLLFCCWYVAELFMCDYYCYPSYGMMCEQNCIKPNAPIMPLIIPTLLWRWSHLSVVFKYIWIVIVAIFRFITQLLGLWDGFFNETSPYPPPSQPLRPPPPPPQPVQPQPVRWNEGPNFQQVPGWKIVENERDWSMQGDEYL